MRRNNLFSCFLSYSFPYKQNVYFNAFLAIYNNNIIKQGLLSRPTWEQWDSCIQSDLSKDGLTKRNVNQKNKWGPNQIYQGGIMVFKPQFQCFTITFCFCLPSNIYHSCTWHRGNPLDSGRWLFWTVRSQFGSQVQVWKPHRDSGREALVSSLRSYLPGKSAVCWDTQYQSVECDNCTGWGPISVPEEKWHSCLLLWPKIILSQNTSENMSGSIF